MRQGLLALIWNALRGFAMLFIALVLGCTENKSLDWYSELAAGISGKVLLAELSTAAACNGARTVSLYEVRSNGDVSLTPLKTISLESDGTYKFSAVRALGVDLKATSTGSYIVKASACGKIISRPVTGGKDQDISIASTLLEQIPRTEDNNVKKLNQLSSADLSTALDAINTATTAGAPTTVSEVYDLLLSAPNAAQKATVEGVFNLSDLTEVKDFTPPSIETLTQPSTLAEGSSLAYAVTVSHWYHNYSYAYEWKVDGVLKNSTDAFSWTTSKNTQGAHTINIKVGVDDGAGNIDTTKPSYSQDVAVTIPNTYPAVVPSVALTSGSPTNSLATTLSLATGASLVNCDTFSNFAVTEYSIPVSLIPADYSGSCTTATSQTVNYTLSAGDGAKTIYVWTKDAAGNVSASASSVSVTLDTTAPVLGLTDIAPVLKGGDSVNVAFSASDATTSVNVLKLQYSTDGSTYSDVADLKNVTSPYSWTVPSTTVASAYLRLYSEDTVGNSSTKVMTAFAIDATAPAAPSISLQTATLTANPATAFQMANCTDTSYILFSESTSTPSASSSSWVTCGTSITYTHVLNGDGAHTVRVWAKDAVGNISATSSTYTVTLDTTSPNLSWTAPTTDLQANTSNTVSWTITDLHTSTSQNVVLEYSSDSGSTWSTLSTQALPATSASSAPYTYSWTTPNALINATLRLTATDSVGNQRVITKTLVIENSAPVLNSLTLADGASAVGISSINALLNVTASTSATAYMRLSELNNFSDTSWVPYSAVAFSFNLSKTGGTKTVYAQVKNSAGLTSNIVNSSVSLEYGTPPSIVVNSPTDGGTYSPGDAMNIAWTCASTSVNAALAANPVSSIQYTVDDGVTYNVIATNLTNNDTATTGHYSWTIPATSSSGQTISSTTPIRVLVGCQTAAGVIATGLSGFQNSIWKQLIGSPGNMDYGVHISAVDLSSWTAVHGDSSNNLYAGSKNGIVKVNRQTGIVEQWLGSLETAGCPTSTVASFTKPRILAIVNDEMIIVSGTCGTITRVKISDKSIVWSRSVDHLYWQPTQATTEGFYNRVANYYYFPVVDAIGAISSWYEVNLNSTTSTPRLILGNSPTCSASTATVGTVSSDNPVTCTTDSNTLVVSPDRQTIYAYHYSGTTYYLTKLTYDSGNDNYIVASVGTVTLPNTRCVQMGSDTSKYYCVRHTGQGRNVTYFDTATGAAGTPLATLSTFNNLSNMQLRLGASDTAVYVISGVTNELFEVKYTGSAFTQSTIGGSPFFTYGNGTDPSKVAFTSLAGLSYNAATKMLYTRGINHIRRMTIDTTTTPGTPFISKIETGMSTATAMSNSSAFGGVAVSKTGSTIVVNQSASPLYFWKSLNLTTWNTVAQTVGAGTNYYAAAAATSYPALGASFTPTASYNLQDWGSTATFLSNDKLYFVGASNATWDQDLWIFQATANTSIVSIAGASGAAGYSAIPGTGAAPLGTPLTRVYGMQPAANDDLLVFDAHRLRRVSVITESGSPKIYDEIDYSTYANYPGDWPWTHAVYDTSTGWSYFVIEGDTSINRPSQIWAVRAAEGWMQIPVTGLSLPGTRNAARGKGLQLEITPLGLLMLDQSKKRILSTPLKAL